MASRRHQPTFDFLTGAPTSPLHAPARPPSAAGFRDSLKTSVRATDPVNEELRIRIQTLEYELKTLREERDLVTHQTQQDVTNVERQAQKEYERAQAADTAKRKAEQRVDALTKEVSVRETQWENEKACLERRLREQTDEARGLREDIEDAKMELAEQERSGGHRAKEAEGAAERLRAEVEQLRREAESNANVLQSERQKLTLKEEDVSRLESELLAARAGGGDADTVGVLKGQLSEQVTHIRKLEMQVREQNHELKAFRQLKKSVEVVEEEKRVLEGRIRMMEGLRKELGEAQLRKQVLEDERQAWQSYLEAQKGEDGDMALQFTRPEDLAKAFMETRLENASLLEKLGNVEPDMNIKDDTIRTLGEEKATLSAEIERLKQGAPASNDAQADSKVRTRLDRQRVLAVKEVEYLRAQLKMFDAEENEFRPEQVDEQKVNRIKELEDLVDQYRNELQSAQADLSACEDKLNAQQPTTGTKRKHDDEDDERQGELKRKYAKLKHEYSKMETRLTHRDNALKAKDTEIEALKAPARTRVLQLVNNPTSKVEQIKMSTLNALQEENRGLHALLEQNATELADNQKFVPKASLDAVRAEMEDLSASLAQEKKLGQRRKDLYAAKAGEFKDAVMALVGWKVNFQPNGRVKVASIFNNDEAMEERGEENSIEFNVEKETMKVSGGLDSEFAREIRPLIEFWVEGKKEIPCLLAAMTLEFYERNSQKTA